MYAELTHAHIEQVAACVHHFTHVAARPGIPYLGGSA